MKQEPGPLPTWWENRLCLHDPVSGPGAQPLFAAPALGAPCAEPMTAGTCGLHQAGVVPVTSAPSMATKGPEGTRGLSVQGAGPQGIGHSPGHRRRAPKMATALSVPPGATMAIPAGSKPCTHGGSFAQSQEGRQRCAPPLELSQSRDPVMAFLFPFIG